MIWRVQALHENHTAPRHRREITQELYLFGEGQVHEDPCAQGAIELKVPFPARILCINHMCLKTVRHDAALAGERDLEHSAPNIDPGDSIPRYQATPRLVFPFRRERPRSSVSSGRPSKVEPDSGASQVGYKLGPRRLENHSVVVCTGDPCILVMVSRIPAFAVPRDAIISTCIAR